MIEAWHALVGSLPFSWAAYDFMKNALLAVIVVTPFFGLAGTVVAGNRMAFFSDAVGHSALTGIALGLIAGFTDMRLPMVVFAVLFALAINLLIEKSRASNDTVIAVFMSFAVALGIALLSAAGSFRKFSVYLVGDILAVGPGDIAGLALVSAAVLVFFFFFGGAITLIGMEPGLAYRSRLSPLMVRTLFSALVSVTVVLSIQWMGLLIVNSLFILPAAAARLVSRTLRGYSFAAMGISLFSGISGLLISYYAGASCGAVIVLCAAFIYAAILAAKGVAGIMARNDY
ncbi:MAG TPA: metal ABC transporter permease [Spirochaetota bacterium]|nr:metal ABC transporter permease [Spirochaetota bacterium]HSA16288.1 metal ABC transporter permease [Spirochaetota bacterium]